jgi:hypothetical protein
MIRIFPITKSLPQDYEMWLENYEADGWNLKKVSLGGWIHHFVKGQPRKIRYCYDYQGKKKMNYEAVFKDVGWEFVYYFFGAYMWRIGYTVERPEAFSDYTTVIGRNNRFLCLFLACFLPYPITIAFTVIALLHGKPIYQNIVY